MPKKLNELDWIEDLLPPDIVRKHMFGGFAYYLQNKMVLAIFESVGDRSYKDKHYDFDIWNGCMFPCEREQHTEILKKYPFLVNHPVLPKWLYLPVQNETFEANAETLLKEIRRRSPLFGVIPKEKKKSAKVNRKKNLQDEKITQFKKPSMFRDELPSAVLEKAKVISDLKNLGPTSEKVFSKAGIKTAQQFIKLGWKKAMIKLVESDPRNRHTMFAYALIGALTNREWNGLSEIEKAEAKEFVHSLPRKTNSKSARTKVARKTSQQGKRK